MRDPALDLYATEYPLPAVRHIACRCRAPDCSVFQCEWCGQNVPWCDGGDDDLCSVCWDAERRQDCTDDECDAGCANCEEDSREENP